MGVKKKWPSNKKFWTIWCPNSERPSKVQFQTREHAERVARQMVEKYSEEFIVMESVKRFEPPPEMRVKVTEFV
jgi:hypothetical protein